MFGWLKNEAPYDHIAEHSIPASHRTKSSITALVKHPIRAFVIVILIQLVFALGLQLNSAERRSKLEAQAAYEQNLAEVRSLSRSLQRDVLNVMFEPDAAERAIIEGKLTSRLAEMQSRTGQAAAELRSRDTGDAKRFVDLETEVTKRLRRV